VPQSRQNPRSAISEDRKMPGWPFVHFEFRLPGVHQSRELLPKTFRYMRQWQMCGFSNSPRIA
jgi:hypothetical protein